MKYLAECPSCSLSYNKKMTYSHSQVYGSKVYDDQIYVIIVNTYL